MRSIVLALSCLFLTTTTVSVAYSQAFSPVQGTPLAIIESWDYIDAISHNERMLALVISAVVISIAIILVALVWMLGMRRAMNEKTRALSTEIRRRADTQASLQEALARVEKAENASIAAVKEKAAFIALVSHELRTPLQGILGATELLHTSRLDEDQANTLAMVRTSAGQLNRVLTDLFDVMGAESGTLSIEPIEFPFDAFAAELEAELRPAAEEQGLAFRFSAEGGKRRIRADKNRFYQVIVNLCSNAIKFTGKGDVELILRLSDEDLYVSVRDTGPGLSREAMDRIFLPFYRAANGSTGGNLGLGLSIVKSIVDAAHGSIRYESNPSIGTRFEVSLPVELVREQAADTQVPASTDSTDASRAEALSGAASTKRAIVAE
ncbi:MAG: HAMP domain-containing histidine kinase, partial [Spirochaetales bacterium]|nr:HAMP domain-containing histidine kinase [Spirochaetales bacterium]